MRAYKKLLLVLIGIFFASIISAEGALVPNAEAKPIHEAFVSKFSDPLPPVIIPHQPPAPINEQVPPKLSNEWIWIPGYWAWSEFYNDFVWICGIWRNPPPNHYWISGSWINQGNGWVWARGFWSPVPKERLSLIHKAPPHSVDDQVTNSPGNNYFWIPGYWEYSPAGGNYVWLSGNWAPLNKNWILTPATYIWRPSGYIFVPLYWDWPLEIRGNAYTCQSDGAPVLLPPPLIIQELFLCYPDYVNLFCYCWYFYPEWWDGCGCVPPWWEWNGWWAFCWGDMWALWWWWGHPGFLPPFWITLELSLAIPPPPLVIIDAFKKMPKPNFPYIPGQQPLLPKGTPGVKDIPKPQVPDGIIPGGQVTPPNFPGRSVTPPSPPQPPRTTIPPDQWKPTYPTTPSYPVQPVYPPQNVQPPTYYPPRPPRHPPKPPKPTPPPTRPTYPINPNQPSINVYPTQPPSRPTQPINPNTPSINVYPTQPQTPIQITPPSTSNPRLPTNSYQPNKKTNRNQ